MRERMLDGWVLAELVQGLDARSARSPASAAPVHAQLAAGWTRAVCARLEPLRQGSAEARRYAARRLVARLRRAPDAGFCAQRSLPGRRHPPEVAATLRRLVEAGNLASNPPGQTHRPEPPDLPKTLASALRTLTADLARAYGEVPSVVAAGLREGVRRAAAGAGTANEGQAPAPPGLPAEAWRFADMGAEVALVWSERWRT